MTGRALPSHVYVVVDDQGGAKIGYASNLDRRLTEIKFQRRRPVRLVWNTAKRTDHRHVEYTAHNLLLGCFTGGEWFAAPPIEAIAAAEKALAMVTAGDLSLAARRLPDHRFRPALPSRSLAARR